ncbi:Gfo/Idh/MocA family oxidoreductase [Brachyspira pilosicoli]|uniref:Oxidoreductase n=2 Tax=Brachyspira pilosicoli TaxID=52584 RepID=A0A3B6VKT0_BRAPL|nr:Gfo/Idh/MocA family oxidoreductase [Brachyspira pilosicoli]AGA66496.1 oxidoreductase [Brachyspira pilosicoli P43/6/78]MBW5392413.1 Gfo/Idh/MocA family oxidoreductase [Brachyspira pilosicoli]MBW5400289.1 Gfo/Idh/MocA family oxidoreductase [Brachyspira pilosicoli]WIH80296.1 Gfo/Idh/MocA family oxidoreductase [Brachyspira pilosicoli]WIH82498.1 Gfo/Idh/MocA family oxidoreductase [Brachyspira pilosicoli]
MDKVNISLIGVGRMGQFHLNVINQINSINLKGIYDADENHLNEVSNKYNINKFSSLDEAIDNSDAVIIASPTKYHFEIAKKALEKGKHVLVEKPMTETYIQAKELQEIVNKKNLILQVGHVERFNGAVQELHHIIEKPYLIEARRLAPFTPRITDVGVVFDIMIHDLDIVTSLVKKPVIRFSASGKRVRTNNEDIASALLEFEDETIATISASRITQEKIRTLAISTEDAYFILDYATQDITIHRQASSESKIKTSIGINYTQESIIERVFIHRDNPLKLEDEHFANCILGKDKRFVSVENDVNTIKLTEDILKKIKETW